MVAVLARESELGRTASECSQRFFLSEVNGKFTEMVEIRKGATFYAILLYLVQTTLFMKTRANHDKKSRLNSTKKSHI